MTREAPPTISVNGKQLSLRESTLEQLLDRLGYVSRAGIAVALDDSVVPRSEWADTRLAHGQRIEIVVAVQGG